MVLAQFSLSALIIAAALTRFFSQLCFTAEMAMVWKLLNVQPLFKGGDMVESNSCRPISTLYPKKIKIKWYPVHDVMISSHPLVVIYQDQF